jgi:hypothetical protein
VVKIAELWLNTFHDLCGATQVDAAIQYVNKLPESGHVASVANGRDLRDAAAKFRVEVNKGFQGLVARPDEAGAVVAMKDHLTFTVIGPAREQLEAYRLRWIADMGKLKEGRGTVAGTALDRNEFNLSSVAVLAELNGRTMLLTGDARGDHLLTGLEKAGKLPASGPLHVDLLKLNHHGSDANVSQKLLDRVFADYYVVSTNGKDHNPDVATLERLTKARGGDAYTMVCTFPEAGYKLVKGTDQRAQERREALQAFDAWSKEAPQAKVTFKYRSPTALSVRVDLGDETIG